ncbi:MAG: Gfo/Idh/MocA family oxidoreductase [Planctomycetota bacterium]
MHVTVEKPMARTVQECENMIAAAEKAKKELMVGFQWRWHPQSRFIRRQVEDGVLGDVVYTRVQALRRRGIPNWGTFYSKEKNGGGPLIDMGVHLLELAVYLMGSKVPQPKRISGNIWTYLGDKPDAAENIWPNWNHKDYTVEDLAVGHVTFDNGSSLVLEASFAAHIKKDQNDVNVMGTKGGAHWGEGEVFHDMNGFMLDSKPGFTRKSDIWVEKTKHFLEVVAGERANESSGYEGLAVQKILNGIYDAAEAGKEVEL